MCFVFYVLIYVLIILLYLSGARPIYILQLHNSLMLVDIARSLLLN
jgi:hypothetical protein